MKKGYPRGGWNRSPPEEIAATHRKIIKLKETGLKLTDIAKQLNVPYGSVTYALYRKNDIKLWQK